MSNSFGMGYIVNYNNELFPSSVRGLSLGLALFIGRLLMSTFPYVSLLTDKLSIHRLAPAIPFSLLALVFSCFLPETFDPKKVLS